MKISLSKQGGFY